MIGISNGVVWLDWLGYFELPFTRLTLVDQKFVKSLHKDLIALVSYLVAKPRILEYLVESHLIALENSNHIADILFLSSMLQLFEGDFENLDVSLN